MAKLYFKKSTSVTDTSVTGMAKLYFKKVQV